MEKPWTLWVERMNRFSKAVEEIGGEGYEVLVGPPASLEDLNALEEKLGAPLPPSFRETLLEFSGKVDYSWSLPDDEELATPLPEEFRGIFSGECTWNLTTIFDANDSKEGWIEAVFTDPADAYDKVWYNKLAFMSVANGDCIAFDLSTGLDAVVVYLSHDDGEGHGYRLGDNFIDFMNRWTSIGCAGCEDWQMLPFITSPTSGIEGNSETAKKWRNWLQMDGFK